MVGAPGWTIAWPPGVRAGARPLPVAVVLHGRGNGHASAFDAGYLGLDGFLAAAVGQGATPFAMASVDGGESYWRAREDGDDAGTMVVDELLPLLAAHGLEVSRSRSSAGRWAGTARCDWPAASVGTGRSPRPR